MEDPWRDQDRGIPLDDGCLIIERDSELARKNGERFFRIVGVQRDESRWRERLIPDRTGRCALGAGYNPAIRVLDQRLIAMANDRHSCSLVLLRGRTSFRLL